MNNYYLLSELYRTLQTLLPLARVGLLTNLSLMVLSLAQSHNCRLATLVTVWPLAGKRDSLIQRARRWLANRHLSQEIYYRPIISETISNWDGSEFALSMDRTDIENLRSILTVGVCFQKRIIPLAWMVLPFGATSAEAQIALLEAIRPLLPDGKKVRITLFADCEFRAVELQKYCRRNHWHWQVGVKSDTYYRTENGKWQKLSTLKPKKGQRLYRQNIYLTKKHDFGLVNLIVEWRASEDHPRYIVLDQKADRHAWRRGRKRFWIEPTFRDWKSYGFDLENTSLNHSRRISNMILAMSISYLWMLYLGNHLTVTGQRSKLEAKHKRDYSLFRLGRDWLRRCFALGRRIPIGFTVTHQEKSTP